MLLDYPRLAHIEALALIEALVDRYGDSLAQRNHYATLVKRSGEEKHVLPQMIQLSLPTPTNKTIKEIRKDYIEWWNSNIDANQYDEQVEERLYDRVTESFTRYFDCLECIRDLPAMITLELFQYRQETTPDVLFQLGIVDNRSRLNSLVPKGSSVFNVFIPRNGKDAQLTEIFLNKEFDPRYDETYWEELAAFEKIEVMPIQVNFRKVADARNLLKKTIKQSTINKKETIVLQGQLLLVDGQIQYTFTRKDSAIFILAKKLIEEYRYHKNRYVDFSDIGIRNEEAFLVDRIKDLNKILKPTIYRVKYQTDINTRNVGAYLTDERGLEVGQ